MKRWILPLLALLMLLSGCAADPPHETLPTRPPLPPEQPEPPGIYIPDSQIEADTNGAVKAFDISGGENQQILPVGENLLLIQKHNEKTEAKLLSGDTLKPILISILETDSVRDMYFRMVSPESIIYYDSSDRAVVFLDEHIREVSRVKMPEDMNGEAWTSPDGSLVYYCRPDGVYAMELKTGIARRIAEENIQGQEITGVLQDGKLIRYSVRLTNGSYVTKLLAAATGATVYEGKILQYLSTFGKNYFAPKNEGSVFEWIYGSADGKPKTLWPHDPLGVPAYLGNGENVIFLTGRENESQLDLYNLESGKRESSLIMPNTGTAYSFARTDPDGVWFLADDTETKQPGLYYWTFEKTAVKDDRDYTSPFYTADTPDADALAQWQKKADEIGEKYGVHIHIWSDAMAFQPEEYHFTAEYLTPAYERYLPRLEQLLSRFPEGFFTKAVDRVKGKKIEICLVRSVAGEDRDTLHAKDNALQYWLEGSPCIALGMDQNMERNFYHEMAHIADSRVLSTTSAYYEWNRKMNPSGFSYYGSYQTELREGDEKYLAEENRYFIDAFSMTFEKEDRARILEYACMPENQKYFESDAMQKKLACICSGIRKSFGLEKYEGGLLWEQYLKQ